MKELKLSDIYSSYLDEINTLRKENKRLQEQLNEANEVIKRTPTLDVFFTFFEMNDYAKEVKKYLEKWGVK